ncbi:LPS O-antigen chain length determinant protein WzzB [Castellaniella sp.]|uniref:LPS O-antigen chain length determinant protein WzzB n=1 Tax=Castellaniella sp. TaxID=1955812 RepID=UPI003C779A70
MQPTPQAASLRTDEIDLRELVLTLWRSRLTILATTLVAVLISMGYILLSTPIYEAKAQTLPPPANALAGYNATLQMLDTAQVAATSVGMDSSSLTTTSYSYPRLSTEDAYQIFLQQLQSRSLLQYFFDTTYLPAHPDAKTDEDRHRLLAGLDDSLTIQVPKNSLDQNQVALTLQGDDPQQVADWTNLYLQTASDWARKQLLDTLLRTLQTQTANTHNQIATLRDVAKTHRQNQIVRLEAALQVAQDIHLADPPTTGNLITSYTGDTLYLRGTKALQAELAVLRARTSDDPYIKELPNLLYAQQLLQKVSLDLKNVTTVTIDQLASKPVNPVKPKMVLVPAIAVLLGLMLGIFFVLVRQAWRQPL